MSANEWWRQSRHSAAALGRAAARYRAARENLEPVIRLAAGLVALGVLLSGRGRAPDASRGGEGVRA